MARNVRITTVSFPGAGSAGSPAERVEANRVAAEALVERAMLDRPDLVALPEVFPLLGLPASAWGELAEPIPGPTTERFAALARRHRCHVVVPLVERRGDRLYNAAALLDRRGEVAGVYHKIFPTIGEIETGIVPGTESTAIETDLGRVAFAICFDLNFAEVRESVRQARPDLVVFPSMYRGGLKAQFWAIDLGVYFVSAITGPHSAIIHPTGRLLALTEAYQPIVSRVVNLDYIVAHIDYNHAKWPAIKERYGAAADLDIASPEGRFVLTSTADGVTAREIAAEFEIELLEEYWARARRTRERALRGDYPAPATTAR